MRAMCIFLAAMLSFALHAQDMLFRFSGHSAALRLASYDPEQATARFSGVVTLRGRVFFEFDSDDGKRGNGTTDFAFLVPDAPSRAKLPAAAMPGYRSREIDYVSLEPADTVLGRLYGARKAKALSHGLSLIVTDEVEVVIEDFTVSVECDAIRYRATARSITPVASLQASTVHSPPGGC